MTKVFLITIFVIMALWLLSRSIRRRKKSKSTTHEASPSRDSASDGGTDSNGFDVFLNFGGPDSRHTVAGILYNTLTNAGFRVFLDDEEMWKGEVIEGELFGAIANARIYVPIFSMDYASRRGCVRALEKMVEYRRCSSGQEKKVILPIFYDVSVNEDVKLRSQVYTSALRKHKEEFGEVVVKPWEDALKEVAKIKGWNLRDHSKYKVANLIKERISSMINAVSSVPNDLVGIHYQMEHIVQLLRYEAPSVRFIVIHGMGGIGKTTLADAVFKKISFSFQGSCILKDVRRYSSDHDMAKLQEKLLLDTLHIKSIEVSNPHDGISQISQRLCNQKVLIVLDDVDKWDHLRNLAAKSDWFGPKSRIIITTRDIGFLPSNDDKQYYYYPMKEMNYLHALMLFCRHAFGNDYPPAEYVDITLDFVETTGGLPLALRTIGSSLYNQDEETWKFRLDKLKDGPHKDVQDILMISYEALESEQQQIFLDIACFFTDEKITDPIYFWEACKFYPKSVIKVLERRSLIKVNEHNEKLWMHDQLRDLGRAIALPKTQHQENNFFWKPSRLWSPACALDIVKKKKVTESIVAIQLAYVHDDCFFVREEFEKAINLKFLQLHGGNFQGDFKNVFCQLRWLSWFNCPLKIEATNLSFPNLVVIKLSGYQITEDWTGWDAIMAAKYLTVMYLDQIGIKELCPSIGELTSLVKLVIAGTSIKQLPEFIGNLRKLEILRINFCPVKFLPESIGRLESLKELDLGYTNITQLPQSIVNLKYLQILKINYCPVEFLPKSLGKLELLNELDLGGTKITQLPDNLGKLKGLEVIKLDFTYIKTLPKALGELKNLKELHACECGCMHGELPEEIGRLPHLRILDLYKSKIT